MGSAQNLLPFLIFVCSVSLLKQLFTIKPPTCVPGVHWITDSVTQCKIILTDLTYVCIGHNDKLHHVLSN